MPSRERLAAISLLFMYTAAAASLVSNLSPSMLRWMETSSTSSSSTARQKTNVRQQGTAMRRLDGEEGTHREEDVQDFGHYYEDVEVMFEEDVDPASGLDSALAFGEDEDPIVSPTDPIELDVDGVTIYTNDDFGDEDDAPYADTVDDQPEETLTTDPAPPAVDDQPEETLTTDPAPPAVDETDGFLGTNNIESARKSDSNNQDETDQDDENEQLMMILYIVIGVAGSGCLLCSFVALCLCRRRARQRDVDLESRGEGRTKALKSTPSGKIIKIDTGSSMDDGSVSVLESATGASEYSGSVSEASSIFAYMEAMRVASGRNTRAARAQRQSAPAEGTAPPATQPKPKQMVFRADYYSSSGQSGSSSDEQESFDEASTYSAASLSIGSISDIMDLKPGNKSRQSKAAVATDMDSINPEDMYKDEYADMDSDAGSLA